MMLMLIYPPYQIIGYSGIQKVPVRICHHIYVICHPFLLSGGLPHQSAEWFAMTSCSYLSALNLDGLTQLCTPSRFAAGDEHLTAYDLVQHEILPSRIQLGQDIVQ